MRSDPFCYDRLGTINLKTETPINVFQVLGRRYRLACGRVLLVGVT